MKKCLPVFIFTAFFQFLHAQSPGQTVSLEATNESLVVVLKSLQSQSGYSMIWVDKQMQMAQKVTITLKNVSLQEALKKIFSNQPLRYLIEEDAKRVIIQMKKKNVLQSDPDYNKSPVDIKGKVVNAKGEPIAGATVSEKFGDRYAATGSDGTFVLKDLPENATLVVSSIGYEPKSVRAGGAGVLQIELTVSAKQMQEVTVVNTGYQQIGKERATGSFEFIKKEELNKQVGTNILNRLEGVSSSILLDRRKLPVSQNSISQNNIIIRGLSTLSDNMKAPLVVVNNFPYEGDINNINPSDVENITILKDAAAASIWGARAANGVIVITTRKPQFNQQLKVSFSANANLVEQPDLNYYPQMPVSDFIGVERFLFDQGFYDGILNSPVSPAVSPVVEILNNQRLGTIDNAEADRLIEALKSQDVRRDFDKYIYHAPVMQQYAINLSGGSDKLKYMLSGGFDQSPSVLQRDQMRRVTFRTDNTLSLTSKLDLQLGLAYTNISTDNNSMGEYGNANYNYRNNFMKLYPYARFADADGEQITFAKDYREGYTDTAGSGKLLDWKYRPLEELNMYDRAFSSQDITANLEARFKFNKSVGFTFRYQYEQTNSDNRALSKAGSYYARNLVNLYTQINGDQVVRIVPEGGIVNFENRKLVAQSANVQVNFNNTWAEKHNLYAIAGGEVRSAAIHSNSSIVYGFRESNYSGASVDFLNLYPRYGNRGEAQIPGGFITNKLMDRFVSLLANASYTYDNRYILSASLRRDASNLFGVRTNNKWKPFWSIGSGWNISNESFYNIPLLPFLQLKATYGVQGNVNNSISPYTIIQMESAQYSIINQPYANITTPGNPDLTWEKTKQLNLSLEFRTARNRFSGRFEMFRKKSVDLILNSTIDPTNGIDGVARNSATMLTRGYEAELNIRALENNFKWYINLSFSAVKNKVIDYLLEDKDRTIGGIIVDASGSITAIRGLQPYTILSYPFAGLDPESGDPRGYLGKEVSNNYQELARQTIDTASLARHGSALPTCFGNFRHSFSYKNFSLHLSFVYRLGYYFRRNSIRYSSLVSSGAGHIDYVRRWQKSGDENITTVPSFVFPDDSYGARDDFYANSSVNVLKGDNVRLQNVNLTYSFRKDRLPAKFFSSLSLFVAANNLGILWKASKEKLDPDAPSALYPQLKSFAIGASVDF